MKLTITRLFQAPARKVFPFAKKKVEEILASDPPSRLTAGKTELPPPFSWLVKEGIDDWTFRAEGAALTVVERTLTFKVRTPLFAFAAWLLLHGSLKETVKREMDEMISVMSNE